MTNKFKKFTCGVLAVVMAAMTMTGCGKEEETIDKKVVTLPAEEQVLQDRYRQNPAITENMVYTTDTVTYIHNPDTTSEKQYVALWKLFDVHTIQIDCMDLIYMGKSTMGDIAKAVDDANEAAITNAIESVRAARQAEIDKEYADAKAKAEAKGKTYTKEKKVADISDIEGTYVNPYRYVLAYDNTDSKTKEQYPYIWEDYAGPKLIDPKVNNTLYLFIYKYDVPYVQCTFKNVEGNTTYSAATLGNTEDRKVKLFNNLIDQEQDWVLTGIAPADCTFLVDQTTFYIPPYVDQDWNSLGSKNNMVTNGNIKFGGEGFTWDSLMTLCNALQLSMKEESTSSWRSTTTYVSNSKACTYTQTSDTNFTYYTIYLPINQFFQQANGDFAIPLAKITVTFDKMTNNCINWNIDYAQEYHAFPSDATHAPAEVISVNVRSHQIDTTDYKGMLTTVNDWVNENKINADFGYYFVDETGTVIGKIDNGLSNYKFEVSIEGEKYYCTQSASDPKAMQGRYISQKERDALINKGVDENSSEFMNAAKLYYIICMAVDTSGAKPTPLGYFNNSGILVDGNKEPAGYYIHSVDYDQQTGYKNAVIIDQDVFDKLLEMYIRTFRFSTAMQDNMELLYEKGDTWDMYQYVKKFVDANEASKEQIKEQVSNDVQSSTSKPTTEIKAEQGSLDIVDIAG